MYNLAAQRMYAVYRIENCTLYCAAKLYFVNCKL